MYAVYIYTRKSEQTKAGKIHEALIPNSPDGDIIKHLIDKRQAEILKGNNILSKVKVDGELITNETHALIGADDKYTNIRTINKSIDEVISVPKRRQIIRYILRHVFAQYWLVKSGYNYDLVADLGHWHNIELLKGSYGKLDKKLFASTLDNVANVDPSLSPAQQSIQRKELEKLYEKTPRLRKPIVTATPKQPAFVEKALKAYVEDEHKGKDANEIGKVKDSSQGSTEVVPVESEPEPT